MEFPSGSSPLAMATLQIDVQGMRHSLIQHINTTYVPELNRMVEVAMNNALSQANWNKVIEEQMTRVMKEQLERVVREVFYDQAVFKELQVKARAEVLKSISKLGER